MSRRPRSFDLDAEPVAKPTPQRRPVALDVPEDFRPIEDAAAQRIDAATQAALEPPPPAPSSRRFSFLRLLVVAAGLLVSLAFGLALDELIRELFDRADWLGWLASGLAALALVAVLGIGVREWLGFRRLAMIEEMRESAAKAHAGSDLAGARRLAAELSALYEGRSETAAGRRALAEAARDIVDPPGLVRIAERDLLAPLDSTARRMALDAAKRVSVVTAVSPRALVDVAFVAIENLRLMRRIADLYGGRPGTLGFWRLARNVVAHLAVTGSIAVGDSMVQQVVGHGLAARLSSRLGEGVVNGLLTARVGIAAMDVCRPVPFLSVKRPGIGDFVAELTRRAQTDASTPTAAAPDERPDRPR